MEALIIAGASAAVLAAIVLTIVPWRRVGATARGFSWRRSISIEELTWKQITESTAQPPGNARNIRKSQKTIWVSRSAAARANGFSSTTSRRVTVYSWEEPHWQRTRTVTVSGEGQAGVRWPSCALGGNEREGQRSGSYKATFQDVGGKQYTRRLREATWRSLEAGTAYSLRLNALGFVLTVGPSRMPEHAAMSAVGERGPGV